MEKIGAKKTLYFQGEKETPQKCTPLSKSESVKIYWLSVKFDWFNKLKKGYC